MKLILFGALKKYYQHEYAIEFPPVATGNDVVDFLERLDPEGGPLLRLCRFSIDRTFVELGRPIGQAQEIALLPPFSGG